MPEQRGYRWGRFQGWVIICLGLPLFLGAPFARSAPMLIGGAFLLVEGAGLVGQKKYGIVLFYVQILLTYAAGYAMPPHPEARIVRWAMLLFLVVPGAFYYPKRWRGLGSNSGTEAAYQQRPTDYLKPMRDLTDEEREEILGHIRGRTDKN